MSVTVEQYEEMMHQNDSFNIEEDKIISNLDEHEEVYNEQLELMKSIIGYLNFDENKANQALEEGYSRIIIHKERRNLTQRESLCFVLNGIFKGFSNHINKPFEIPSEIDSTCIYLTDLWEYFKKGMQFSPLSVNSQQCSYKYFKEFIEHNFEVRDYQGIDMATGKQLSKRKIILGLPELQSQWEFLNVKILRNKKGVLIQKFMLKYLLLLLCRRLHFSIIHNITNRK